jgi:GPI-anchor transamidase subunit K
MDLFRCFRRGSWLCCCFLLLTIAEPVASAAAAAATGHQHKSNYAVVLSSSRYWFNYRHTANALSVYQILKRNGFDDDDIVLMLADEWSVNPRNPAKNHIYNTATDGLDGLPQTGSNPPRSSLLTVDTIIDNRSEDVTVEQFLSVLLNAPTNEYTNILIYINGHGGDQFFKFQGALFSPDLSFLLFVDDCCCYHFIEILLLLLLTAVVQKNIHVSKDVEEVMTAQLGDVLQQLHLAKKYHQVLFVADTCQAFTLADGIIKLNLPNVAVIGSSLKGQSSYAHTSNPILGLSVIEKYTHYFTDRVERNAISFLNQSVRSFMVEGYSKDRLGKAELGLWDTFCEPNMTLVPMKHFWQQKRRRLQRRHQDSSSILALAPLPAGLVQSFSSLIDIAVEDKMVLRPPLTCDSTRGDAECIVNATTQQQGLDDRPLLEPTSFWFLLLVFGLITSVAIGSAYL